jgi:hypothetical protein
MLDVRHSVLPDSEPLGQLLLRHRHRFAQLLQSIRTHSSIMRALCASTAERSTGRSASICSRLFAIRFTYLSNSSRRLRSVVASIFGAQLVPNDRDC